MRRVVAVLGLLVAACAGLQGEEPAPLVPVPLPVPAPAGLRQLRLDGSSLPSLGDARADAVRLLGTVRAGNANACKAETRLEVELRPYGERFTGIPTHVGGVRRSGPEQGVDVEVAVRALPWGAGFLWRARQVRDEVWMECNNGNCRCRRRKIHHSGWVQHAVPPLFSFRTPLPRQNVVEWPSEVTAIVGDALGGDRMSLRSADADDYRLLSAAGSPSAAVWEATFRNVTPRSASLEGRLRSRTDLVCTQTIRIFHVPSGAWMDLVSGTLPTVPTDVRFAQPGGLSDFVDAEGDLRVQVECAKSAPPRLRYGADLLEIAYERATLPRP